MPNYPTKVDVLGTTYTIYEVSRGENKTFDKLFEGGADAFTDPSTKEIIVLAQDPLDFTKPANADAYRRETVRHEIVHAFLMESGLDSCSNACQSWAVNEEMVDWVAVQFPKMLKAFQEAGCL